MPDVIRFTYATGELGCVFINPAKVENAVYPVYSVWKYLFPNDKIDYSNSDWNFNVQLENCKRLISERLVNVVNGDFTWTEGYHNKNSVLSAKIQYMFNSLDRDNAILRKFWNEDPSWEQDFDRHGSDSVD